jgi:toxin FitB
VKYLVDTNVISEVMRKNPDPGVTAWFQTLDRVATSVICLDELVYGLRRRQAYGKEAWLRRMLADVGQILPVTHSAAQWSGERRALLESQGTTVHQADALIAACAWEHRLVLATRNIRDFEGYGIPLFNPFEYEPSN